MKAFLVGLMFLILVVVMAILGIFLWPLLFVLGMALRIALFIVFTIFAIWLLGKLIIIVWESLRGKSKIK